MDIIFEHACQVAADVAIASIHVVPTQRLTYDDFVRYRRRAEALHLGFMLTKTKGALGFRLFRRDPGTAVVASGAAPEGSK